MLSYTDHNITANGINLHYIEYPDNGPAILLMHGLTANSHAFDGLVAAGLTAHFHVYSVDLRGRGLSDHPAFCYDMKDHAHDIIDLLNHLGVQKIVLCGHSFGGLLSFYLAANYPERIEKIVVLDAAARMNPNAAEMLGYRLSKLEAVYPSWDAYIAEVKAAPYNDFWDEAMESYYQADVKQVEGGVTPRSNLTNIIAASMGLANISWPSLMQDIHQPVLLVNAPDNYNMGEPLLPDFLAEETVEMLPNGKYVCVAGNHQTMLYGAGARQIVNAVNKFIQS